MLAIALSPDSSSSAAGVSASLEHAALSNPAGLVAAAGWKDAARRTATADLDELRNVASARQPASASVFPICHVAWIIM